MVSLLTLVLRSKSLARGTFNGRPTPIVFHLSPLPLQAPPATVSSASRALADPDLVLRDTNTDTARMAHHAHNTGPLLPLTGDTRASTGNRNADAGSGAHALAARAAHASSLLLRSTGVASPPLAHHAL